MKRTFKSKKGFSLVELMCVLAILVILGSACAFGYMKIVKNLPWQELFGTEAPFK